MNHRRLSKVIITLLGFELKVWNRIELVLVWSSILKSVSNKRVSATNDPVFIKEIQKNRILELLLIIAGAGHPSNNNCINTRIRTLIGNFEDCCFTRKLTLYSQPNQTTCVGLRYNTWKFVLFLLHIDISICSS